MTNFTIIVVVKCHAFLFFGVISMYFKTDYGSKKIKFISEFDA